MCWCKYTRIIWSSDFVTNNYQVLGFTRMTWRNNKMMITYRRVCPCSNAICISRVSCNHRPTYTSTFDIFRGIRSLNKMAAMDLFRCIRSRFCRKERCIPMETKWKINQSGKLYRRKMGSRKWNLSRKIKWLAWINSNKFWCFPKLI